MFSRIEVFNQPELKSNDSITKYWQKISPKQIKIEEVIELRTYKIDSQKSLNKSELAQVFIDPYADGLITNEKEFLDVFSTYNWFIDISYRPGVTDNEGKTAEDAFRLLGLKVEKVFTGRLYALKAEVKKSDDLLNFAQSFFANSLIQQIQIYHANDNQFKRRFTELHLPFVHMNSSSEVKEIDLSMDVENFLELNQKNCWALTTKEFQVIQNYFKNTEVILDRKTKGLGGNLTDVEMEIIAQTWSEHCKHKIFAANIDYQEHMDNVGVKIGSRKINGLFKTFIKGVTEKIIEQDKIDWAISLFKDNAGIVRLDEKLDFCLKVETHNSPSALDPYGGALTGILGVNRDILGAGLGAKPIANTDVFCLAYPDFPNTQDEWNEFPKGLKHPKRIFEGVHKGVEDGGNKSGIPTVNGAIVFDENYAGKPLVFCGTLGILPQVLPDGRKSAQKKAEVGDFIVVVGGSVGADGIHGATFSSLELDEHAPSTAVQIGDPITQKRVIDFILKARDLGWYNCITDNGAGGISSSIGEMASSSGGAVVQLEKNPLKYPGLKPYEIMISESQERITLAVPKKYLQAFIDLSNRMGVQAVNIGQFNNSGFLHVTYHEKTVAYLSLDFIHDGLPAMELKAHYDGPRIRENWKTEKKKTNIDINSINDFGQTFFGVLSEPNVASKEKWVRSYDHEVQGATFIKPFGGNTSKSPNDSGVIALFPHGGSKDAGVVLSNGLCPHLSLYDTYLMAQVAIDEAIRNAVAVGANPQQLCLVDNFCWPDPVQSEKNQEGSYKLGQLVRCNQGLFDAALTFKAPFISGKDSMKNDFRGELNNGKKVHISVLPTLLVTCLGKIEDLKNTSDSCFKNSGDLIYKLGGMSLGLSFSVLDRLFLIENSQMWNWSALESSQLYNKIYNYRQHKKIQSCHDISDGGLAVALAESMFGEELGCQIDLMSLDENLYEFMFSETPGSFIVSINPDDQIAFEKYFAGEFTRLGFVSKNPDFNLISKIGNWKCETKKLKNIWESFDGN